MVSYNNKYIRALNGIRAISIIIIVWFHFWQQSWLMPTFGNISLDFIPRYGFLFVDMMIFLSGFCLFIPYARNMVYKDKITSTKDFYIRRIARIFPSYYLSMIVSIIFLILFKKANFNAFFLKDTIMHIFFINNWSYDTIILTNYIAVLWTVAIEVQFYILFPFIANCFKKKPTLTYSIMCIIGLVSTYFISNTLDNTNTSYYVNHFLLFIPVFANGMLASLFYISFTKKNNYTKENGLFFTMISIFSIMVYVYFCKTIDAQNIQIWQINNRFMLSLLFMVFTISTLLSSKTYLKLFSNKFMDFIAKISFNLYIYHQFIAVLLKEYHIPYYSGNISPNITGDSVWQLKYFILCIIISLVVATMITYFFEIPISKYIKKRIKCSD